METQESVERKLERFQRMLQAQAELYRTLVGLAKKQAREISDRNIERFMHLLEEKRALLQEIESIEVSCAPLRALWDSENKRVDDGMRTRMRAAVEEIRALLETLLELENACQQKLADAKISVEEELRQVNAGPGVIRSYRGLYQCKPRFMNEIG